MKISKDTVEYVANLAKLDLTEEEKNRLMLDMERIILYFDKISNLDTTQIVPTDYVIPVINVFRDDKACNFYDREEMLKNAPSKEKGFFKVPKIFE
ncbi:MAG TPA: Asp-tRNA(Asn)/Glu-tRNA(Gln) amidotransferase subunit GatC [Acetivibrio sp.]|nr:Asp-tRNA(Asn)/Glu-tRNA(Gln) amidotransferase subunit GatC [Acetivibrio sp.]